MAILKNRCKGNIYLEFTTYNLLYFFNVLKTAETH